MPQAPPIPRYGGPTQWGWLKPASFVLALMIALGAVAGVVYAAGVIVTSKADRSELHGVEQTVNQIRTDVEVIKHEQRTIIRILKETR